MANIPFRTAYSGHVRKTVPGGTGFEKEYGYDVDSKGRKIVVCTGEKNLQEEINSHLEGCLIENILARAELGDMSGFREQGTYMDTTEIPTNLIEAKREMLKLENAFNALPAEVKSKYNFSVEEFIADAGTENWATNMGINKTATEVAPTLQAAEIDVELPKEVNK